MVKSLRTQLEGEVTVESPPGHGSTSRVRLPLMPSIRSAPPADDTGEDAEDDEPDRDHAERQLTEVGTHAAQAQHVAASARTRARQGAKNVPRRRRIVFADDLEVNRHLMERFFQR